MCEKGGMTQHFVPPEDSGDFARLLASKVKVSPGYASDLARGVRKPSLTKAVAFEKAYGIPPSFWTERV